MRLYPTFQPQFESSEHQTSQLTICNILNERTSMDTRFEQPMLSITLDTMDLSVGAKLDYSQLEEQVWEVFQVAENLKEELTCFHGVAMRDLVRQLKVAGGFEKLIQVLGILENMEQGKKICRRTNKELG